MSVKEVLIHHTYKKQIAFLAFVLLAISLFGIFNNSVFAENSSVASDQRLVTIHDQGSSVTIVTRSSSVAEAISQADIAVSQKDIVEPALTEKLVAKTYQINIFRARPVIVVLGDKQVKVMTAEQSPRQIAEQAGFKFYDEDKARFERTSDILSDDGIAVKMIIEPATVFNLTLYGKRSEIRAQGKTVGEMMSEKGLSLADDDKVSPAKDTPLVAGMEVKIWREGIQTISVEEVVAKPIEEIKDRDHEKGWREVKVAGKDGKRQVTYEIVIQDGVEVSRKEIASVTTLEPVKEVVVVGAKPKTYTGSHADWMTAAGISPADFDSVEKLIQKESGWRPHAVNPSSGACGLVQALPCSKLGPDWSDPIVALRWGQGYVDSRYGGWAGALAHSQRHGWY